MKRLLALLVATLLIAGCSKPEDAFIGEWFDREDEGISIEFFDSGAILIKEIDGGDEVMTGTFELMDEERMALELTEGDDVESIVVTYEFDGDALLLTADGDTIRLTQD